jgi:PKD repeat protein
MALPTVAYPAASDSNLTLYSVKDTLSLSLAKDYMPGDSVIYVEQNQAIMDLFPNVGIITLTEQCSEPELRAVSFYYDTKDTTNFSFSNLTILPETPDSEKRSGITKVTMNVVAQHHNNIKDAIIAIQKQIGLKNDRTTKPFDGNIVQRTEYLLGVVFTPRAWFTANKIVGVAPLTIEFTSRCFQLGEDLNDNNITYYWDFGDSTGSNVSAFPFKTTEKTITHIFERPGNYTIKHKVTNKYGEDSVSFANMINVRYYAPDEATIEYHQSTSQIWFEDNGYLKTPAGVPVYLYIPSGINPLTGNYYNGELIGANGEVPDKIVDYTWNLSDDIAHANSISTNALYTVGGYYDIALRTDTKSNSFRITQLKNYINVVERFNAWLFTISTSQFHANEFGFLSEIFKVAQTSTSTISRNNSFLTSQTNKEQLLREFYKNTNMVAKSTTPSGFSGSALLQYAGGRYASDSPSLEPINSINFNGFNETYSAYPQYTGRPWNWISFNNNGHAYFILGNAVSQPSGTSPTNMGLLDNSIQDETFTVLQTYTAEDFTSQANSLKYNAAQYNSSGESTYGNFSAYRSAFKNNLGYILKNNTVGSGFQIKAFYGTESDDTYAVSNFIKYPDIVGPAKLEGQLVAMSSYIYFFNNTGAISAFNPTTKTWSTGGPGYNSIAFNNLQDTSVQDFDDENNTLMVTTDSNHNAYLSFDYSNKSFLKWNDLDLTFTALNSRPSGTQWIFGNY